MNDNHLSVTSSKIPQHGGRYGTVESLSVANDMECETFLFIH